MHPPILGSVGVSGRYSHSKDHKTIEDHELAEIAALTLERLFLKVSGSPSEERYVLKKYMRILIKEKKQ